MNIEQEILNVEIVLTFTSTFKIPCSIFDIPSSVCQKYRIKNKKEEVPKELPLSKIIY